MKDSQQFDDFEDIIEFLKEKFFGRTRKERKPENNNNSNKDIHVRFKGGLGGIIILFFLIFLGTGIYQVGPDE
ncbi:MAG: hypothetical protein DSY38_04735, partial [Fusobacteria bacterium]